METDRNRTLGITSIPGNCNQGWVANDDPHTCIRPAGHTGRHISRHPSIPGDFVIKEAPLFRAPIDPSKPDIWGGSSE